MDEQEAEDRKTDCIKLFPKITCQLIIIITIIIIIIVSNKAFLGLLHCMMLFSSVEPSHKLS